MTNSTAPKTLDVTPSGIPSELLSLPRWVLWSWQPRGDKWTKPPYQVNGRKAKATDPATWTTYGRALAALQRGKRHGIGLALVDTDDLAAIDLDHCVEPDDQDEIADWAAQIVQSIGSYTELSPSGTGLRVLVRARLPQPGRKRGNVEAYEAARYVTITGHRIPGAPAEILHRQDAVDAFHAEHFPAEEPAPPAAATWNLELDDHRVLELATRSRNGSRISALYNGDNSLHNGDASAGDLALVRELAFYAQDPDQLDRLIRASGRMRPKWDTAHSSDGRTYGQMTITKALASVKDRYPPKAPRPPQPPPPEPPPTALSNGRRKVEEPPRLEKPPAGPPPGTDIHVSDRDDGGPASMQRQLAERFVRRYRDSIRHVHGMGWLVWHGTHWAEDDNATAHRGASSVVRDRLHVIVELHDTDERKRLFREATKVDTSGGIAAMLAYAATMLPTSIPPRDLDRDPWLLNTPGCTIDLRTGEQRAHRPDDMVTKITAAELAPPDTPAPHFQRFLERVIPSVPLRRFVQRALGSALVGEVREHSLPIWTGTGANGKGTLRDAVLHVLGSYAIEVDPEILMQRQGDRHSTELMDLLGVRLAFMSETDEYRRFNAAKMKRLVGGDPIRARRMHKDPVQFDPSHSLTMLTNHLPGVAADDNAVWRRLHVVRFGVEIPRDERDAGLGAKLRGEAPQILRWLLEGWVDYYTAGLRPPAEVDRDTDAYRQQQDLVGMFLEECTVAGEDRWTTASALYAAYRDWCDRNGHRRPLAANKFAPNIEARGYERVRLTQGRRYLGLEINTPTGDTPPPEAPDTLI